MRSQFEETGLTFSREGSPYCPIERKRRGPAALVAAMAMFALGAGVFGYSLLGQKDAPPRAGALSAALEARQSPNETSAQIPEKTNKTKPSRTDAPGNGAPPKDGPMASAPPSGAAERLAAAREAIAQSRALRAGATAPGPGESARPEEARAVKPADTSTPAARGFAPRLKPARLVAARRANAGVRPLRLDGVRLAAAEDRPPPFFFPGDMERREIVRRPAALALAGDIDRAFARRQVRVDRGETFVDALKRAGVGAADRNAAAYAFGKHYNLRRLRPGQEFDLTLGWPNQTLFQLAAAGEEPPARLLALDFRSDAQNRIVIRRNAAGGYDAETRIVPLTTRTMAISGVINGSLYESAKAVGAPDQIIADLADAFSYDVDFQREIFGGDEFEAIFEVKYDDRGVLAAAGDIVYARLNWRGRREEKGYYRFASAEDGGRADFYDATGQSARRLLMKTPIDGARLSSGFGTRRHPILGYRRAHKGVDFAAPRGTPIKAAGDGVVERADRYGSFGNYIRIRHANGYKTAYAHLKGFRRGVRKGRRVRQGDIIGYVGTTGRSTGPHLHYEVHLNGKAVNPQRLKISTTGKTLAGAELERFRQERARIDAMRAPPRVAPPLFAKEDKTAAESAL